MALSNQLLRRILGSCFILDTTVLSEKAYTGKEYTNEYVKFKECVRFVLCWCSSVVVQLFLFNLDRLGNWNWFYKLNQLLLLLFNCIPVTAVSYHLRCLRIQWLSSQCHTGVSNRLHARSATIVSVWCLNYLHA